LSQFIEDKDAEIQLEAVWCITNISSGTLQETKSIISTIPFLIAFLKGSNRILQEQAAWAISNIAAEECLKHILIENGVLHPLLDLLDSKVESIVQVACWALCNLVRDVPLSPFYQIDLGKRALRIFSGRKDVLRVEAAWLLVFMTSGPNEEFQYILHLLNNGLLDLLNSQMKSTNQDLLLPCLRIYGNIMRGPNDIISKCLSKDWLHYLYFCLDKQDSRFQKESAWILSNIAAGTNEHVDLIMNLGFLPLIAKHMGDHDTETIPLKVELLYCVINLSFDGRYWKNILNNETILNGIIQLIRQEESVSVICDFLTFICTASKSFDLVTNTLLTNVVKVEMNKVVSRSL
jgi:importin subunit alpha-1